jgi:2-dehydro-3-deoxyphosphogluconate aldolase/(4S)-4-hydroxy-2-oxoglutarate aldolase
MNAIDTIRQQGVIAIVRERSAEHAIEVTRQLISAGIRAVEISLVTPDATRAISVCREAAPAGVDIGVGTVMTADELAQAVDSGATFAIAPVLSKDLVRRAVNDAIPFIPGVGTATEAVEAMGQGASMVKLFPASTWSPAAMADVLTALPRLPFVPTGGIALSAAPSWITAGAMAVGLGGALSRIAGTPGSVRSLLDNIAASREK